MDGNGDSVAEAEESDEVSVDLLSSSLSLLLSPSDEKSNNGDKDEDNGDMQEEGEGRRKGRGDRFVVAAADVWWSPVDIKIYRGCA